MATHSCTQPSILPLSRTLKNYTDPIFVAPRVMGKVVTTLLVSGERMGAGFILSPQRNSGIVHQEYIRMTSYFISGADLVFGHR